MTSGAPAPVLLQALAVFLGEHVRPAIADKGLSFRVRIAQHLAMSLAFELGVGEGHDRAAIQRISALLDVEMPSAGTASEAASVRARLDADLASAIQEGTVDRDAALAHLVAALTDELSITNPRFDLDPELP